MLLNRFLDRRLNDAEHAIARHERQVVFRRRLGMLHRRFKLLGHVCQLGGDRLQLLRFEVVEHARTSAPTHAVAFSRSLFEACATCVGNGEQKVSVKELLDQRPFTTLNPTTPNANPVARAGPFAAQLDSCFPGARRLRTIRLSYTGGSLHQNDDPLGYSKEISAAGGVFPEVLAINGITVAAMITPAAPYCCFHHDRWVGQESGSALIHRVNAISAMTISNMGFSDQNNGHLLSESGISKSVAFLKTAAAQT
jgi:hypothetical protein